MEKPHAHMHMLRVAHTQYTVCASCSHTQLLHLSLKQAHIIEAGWCFLLTVALSIILTTNHRWE